MKPSLKDQVAVVTGASSGIGQAIALALAAQGVALCLVGRNQQALEETRHRASAHSLPARSYLADLSVDQDLENLAEQLRRDCPKLDVLVHCAGIFHSGSVASAPVSDFDLQYRINVRAPFRLTQALLPSLQARQGQVVFINSSAGLTTRANISQYAATKHALKALADSLRDEVNNAGIRVLSVFPGRTATPQQIAIHKEEGKPYQPNLLLQPADVAEVVFQTLCLERTAEVTNISVRPMRKT
jgi:short-subunit dehydrogenase